MPSREVLALTGTTYPMMPISTLRAKDAKNKKTQIKWKWHPINLGNRSNQLREDEKIYHWVQEKEMGKEYPYLKFNIKVDIVPRFTDEEYDTVV